MERERDGVGVQCTAQHPREQGRSLPLMSVVSVRVARRRWKRQRSVLRRLRSSPPARTQSSAGGYTGAPLVTLASGTPTCGKPIVKRHRRESCWTDTTQPPACFQRSFKVVGWAQGWASHTGFGVLGKAACTDERPTSTSCAHSPSKEPIYQ